MVQLLGDELTFQRSYMARLKYVYDNPVRHRLVRNAADYPWCSASHLEKNAFRGFLKALARFKTDRLGIQECDPALPDDFELT